MVTMSSGTPPEDRGAESSRGAVPLDRVVIVGASLAGLRAAETLRRRAFAGAWWSSAPRPTGPTTGRRCRRSCWRATGTPTGSTCASPRHRRARRRRWDSAWRAERLDLAARTLVLADGGPLAFDGLVIATGAAPSHRCPASRLPTASTCCARSTTRSPCGRDWPTAASASSSSAPGSSASRSPRRRVPARLRGRRARRGSGAADPRPRCRDGRGRSARCTPPTASTCAAAWRSPGFTDDGVLTRPMDEPGGGLSSCPPTSIVVGIGVTPATGWLDGSGLELRDGVVCDEPRVRSMPDRCHARRVRRRRLVRWPNALFGEEMRVEHWTNAAEQGAPPPEPARRGRRRAAEPYAPVPFFWSDQFEHRIQFLGHADAAATRSGRGRPIDGGQVPRPVRRRRPAARRPRRERPALVMPTRRLLLEPCPGTKRSSPAAPPS